MKFAPLCRSLITLLLWGAGFLALVSTNARAQSVVNFGDVIIRGNRRIDADAIKGQLAFKRGSVTEQQITEEVKSLYKTGFFSQVTAAVATSPERPGEQVIIYTVVEKPVVRKIFIKGNKEVSEEDLKSIFKVGANRFLDRTKVFGLTKSAIALYQSKGFYDAAFDYSVVPVDNNQVDLVLTVTEGKRSEIVRISFRGLTTLDPDELRAVMQTKRYKWWNSWLFGTGRLNQEMLDNDKALLRQYFLDHGLIDATLSDPTIEMKDGEILISFEVNEGPQYRLGKISTTGDALKGKSSSDLLEGVDLESGDIFSAAKVRENAFKVSDKFTDVGYAFANVVPDTKMNRQTKTVDVEYGVTKGNLVRVNRITLRGNDKTYDNVIRRELTIDEQDIYSSSKIKRSERLLQRLGYFDEASITNEPSQDKDSVNLLVSVREAATGTFSAGAGFSTADGVLFNTRLSENNVFGTGRNVSVNLDLGTQRTNGIITVADPRINDSFLSGSIDALQTFRRWPDFDQTLSGGSLELGYPLEQIFGESFEDVSVSNALGFYLVDYSNIDKAEVAPLVVQSEGSSTAATITPRIVRNTINNPLNPRDGSRQVLSFETAGFGGEDEFYLVEARNQFYRPLFDSFLGEWVFSWRTSVAMGESLNDNPFPLFKRFFPGGINSVRGFKNRRLGPQDTEGHEYGGASQIVNNLETIFPIFRSAGLNGVIFYDAGEAFDDGQSIRLQDLRQGYGFGFRWLSPIGPLRVEFGVPINRREEESSFVTMFSFGAPL